MILLVCELNLKRRSGMPLVYVTNTPRVWGGVACVTEAQTLVNSCHL